MADRVAYRYDVYISHSDADQEWVDTELVPLLKQAKVRVALRHEDFPLGAPHLINVERFIEESRRTVVVLTPDWLANEWTTLEGILVSTADPAAQQRKLLPILLKPCTPPKLIALREKLDLTSERNKEKQIARLIRNIQDTIPIPPPWTGGRVRNWATWKEWLVRYRKEIRCGAVGLLVLWLLGSVLLQLWPFRPREVWMPLSQRMPKAMELFRAGDTLFVAGANEEYGCDPDQRGLWRSQEGKVEWQRLYPDLCFPHPKLGNVLADIVDLAWTENAPKRIYAASSDVGLLRSDDGGLQWYQTGRTGLNTPKLGHVAVDAVNPDRVYVSIAHSPIWPEGIYRSDDGGQSWRRLDRQEDGLATCKQGIVLTRTLTVGTLLTTPARVIVGTGDPDKPTDTYMPSGLYASSDGGECWTQLHAGTGDYQYVELAPVPDMEGQSLLILTRNWSKDGRADLWLMDTASAKPELVPLWNHSHTRVNSILAKGGDDPHWYIVTDFGQVWHDAIKAYSMESKPAKLPRINRCLLTCSTDLVPDVGSGPPLLLAGDRVYRWTRGPWWRRIWT